MSGNSIPESKWEVLKEPIRVFYLVEDHSLTKVMEEMATKYGFKATKAQYELQVKTKWGFRKNLSKDQWEIIVYKFLKRKRDCPTVHLYIDEILVDPKRLKKAISRHRAAQHDFEVESPTTPEGVTFQVSTWKSTGSSSTSVSSTTAASLDVVPPPEGCYLPTRTSAFAQFQADIDVHAAFLAPDVREVLPPLPTFCTDNCVLANNHNGVEQVQFNRAVLKRPKTDLSAILPAYLLPPCHSGVLGNASTNHSKPMDLFYICLYLLSNKFLSSGSYIATEIYHWLRPNSESTFLQDFVSAGGSFAEAVMEELLAPAIEANDIATLSKIVQSGIDPNKVKYFSSDGEYLSPLEHACKKSHLELARLLLAFRADANGSQDTTYPLLTRVIGAVRLRGEKNCIDMELVTALLAAGADPNQISDESPLTIAANLGDVDLVSILLSKGADPNLQDGWRNSPLVNAIKSKAPVTKSVAIIHLLLRAGADVHASDEHSTGAALRSAIFYENSSAVQVLLEAGAVINEPAFIWLLKQGRLKDITFCLQHQVSVRILIEATKHASPDVFHYLFGIADIRVQNQARSEALVEAIENGRQDVIDALVTSGVNLPSSSRLEKAMKAVIRRGDSTMLRWLLREDSHYCDMALECLGSCFYHAVASKQKNITSYLLDIGANVNFEDPITGVTPLLEAILQDDPNLALHILAAGGRVTTGNKRFRARWGSFTFSVLPAAVFLGCHPLILDLINGEVDVNAPGMVLDRRENGTCVAHVVKTPLTVAVERNEFELVNLLIAAGADVNAPAATFSRRSALAAAVSSRNINMVDYFLKQGASPDERALEEAVSHAPEFIHTLLMARNQTRLHRSRDFGLRALVIAVKSSNTTAIQQLLANGVEADLLFHDEDFVDESYGTNVRGESPDMSGSTSSPLGYAIELPQDREYSMVHTLLEGGADPNAIVRHAGCDSTALSMAIERRDLRLIEIFLNAGAHVNPEGAGNTIDTPLQIAAKEGYVAAVELFLERGADVNAPPRRWDGATALEYAALGGYYDIVNLLLEKGAVFSVIPAANRGRTALEGAAESGRIAVLQLLLSRGAKVTGPGKRQFERACKSASDNGHFAARRLLEAWLKKIRV